MAMAAASNQRRMSGSRNQHQLISISEQPFRSRSASILNRAAATSDGHFCPPLRSCVRPLFRRTKLLGFLICLFVLSFYISHSPFRKLLSKLPPSALAPVTRDVLDRLDKLQASFEPADDDPPSEEIQGSNRTLDSAMPKVTALPGKPLPQPSNPSPSSPVTSSIPAQELDPITCPVQFSAGLPCAFILPAWVGEQETKAQIHLHQLGLLALHLNRTLVLPNVSKSRMGTCLTYPFDLYYHTQALANLGVPTITYANFLNWTLSRSPPPSAQLVAIQDGKNVRPGAPPDSVRLELGGSETVFPTKPDRNLCLSKGKSGLNFTSLFPLTIASPERWHNLPEVRDRFASKIISSLATYETPLMASGLPAADQRLWRKPHVLVLNYDLRHPVFGTQPLDLLSILPTSPGTSVFRPLPPFQHFPYASTWTELAEVLARELPPYVALHWRQETLSVSTLERCVRSLLPRLKALKKSFPSLGALYLSTDYPIDDVNDLKQSPVAHSGTFSKLLTPAHHSLMKYLVSELEQGRADLDLITFERALRRATIPESLVRKLLSLPNLIDLMTSVRTIPHASRAFEKELVMQALTRLDPGLVGIIEKTIAVRANVFLTGLPNECSKPSSFTRQIVESRLQSLEEEHEGLMDSDHSLFMQVEVAEMKASVLNVVEYWDAN